MAFSLRNDDGSLNLPVIAGIGGIAVVGVLALVSRGGSTTSTPVTSAGESSALTGMLGDLSTLLTDLKNGNGGSGNGSSTSPNPWEGPGNGTAPGFLGPPLQKPPNTDNPSTGASYFLGPATVVGFGSITERGIPGGTTTPSGVTATPPPAPGYVFTPGTDPARIG
jgi:hypothetical protein